MATDASLASDLSGSTVVVTTFGHLKANLLHALYSDAGARSCPGLICASGVEELRRQALVRSILASPRLLDEAVPWTAIFPTERTVALAGHGHQVFDARSSTERVRSALIARSGLLVIATHSDGVDAFLGRSLTFCAISEGGASADEGRAPSCWLSGYCHRHGVSVPEFRKLGVSISPTEVSAGILILDTCFGAMASDAPIIEQLLQPLAGVARKVLEQGDDLARPDEVRTKIELYLPDSAGVEVVCDAHRSSVLNWRWTQSGERGLGLAPAIGPVGDFPGIRQINKHRRSAALTELRALMT